MRDWYSEPLIKGPPRDSCKGQLNAFRYLLYVLEALLINDLGVISYKNYILANACRKMAPHPSS